jgi:hypothetical protein
MVKYTFLKMIARHGYDQVFFKEGSGQALRNFTFLSSAPVISARKQHLSMKLLSMIDISEFYCQNKFELDWSSASKFIVKILTVMEFPKMEFFFGVCQLNINYSALDWFWNDNLIVNFKLTDGTIRIIVGFFLSMFPNRGNCRKWPLRNFILLRNFTFFLLFFSDSFLYIFPVIELVNEL